MLAVQQTQRALRQGLRLENLMTAAVGVDVRDHTEGFTGPNNGDQRPFAIYVRQIELYEALAEPKDEIRRCPVQETIAPFSKVTEIERSSISAASSAGRFHVVSFSSKTVRNSESGWCMFLVYALMTVVIG